MWTETILYRSACAVILYESIPCLKRVKRTQKGVHISARCSSEEACACISVMYGTMLKLYPLGSKTPTFGSRVTYLNRIGAIVERGPDYMIR